jgi:hypothetical protein
VNLATGQRILNICLLLLHSPIFSFFSSSIGSRRFQFGIESAWEAGYFLSGAGVLGAEGCLIHFGSHA